MSDEIIKGESPTQAADAQSPRTVWWRQFALWLGKQSLPGLVGKLLGDTRSKDWLIEQQAAQIVKLEAMNLALLNTLLFGQGVGVVTPGVRPPVPDAHTERIGGQQKVHEWREVEQIAEDVIYGGAGAAILESLSHDRSPRGAEKYRKVSARVAELRLQLENVGLPPSMVVEMDEPEETLQ